MEIGKKVVDGETEQKVGMEEIVVNGETEEKVEIEENVSGWGDREEGGDRGDDKQMGRHGRRWR